MEDNQMIVDPSSEQLRDPALVRPGNRALTK